MEIVQFIAHGLACGAWVLSGLSIIGDDHRYTDVFVGVATALSCIAWRTP